MEDGEGEGGCCWGRGCEVVISNLVDSWEGVEEGVFSGGVDERVCLSGGGC